MTPKSNVRAVFFDVGGTLIEPWPSVGDVYARVALRHEYQVQADQMDRAFRAAWKRLKSEATGGTQGSSDKDWWQRLVFDAMDELALDPDRQRRTRYFEELYEAFVQPDAWRIFDDVVETLAALRSRGLHMGALSNWDERLRPLLTSLELIHAFDSVTISCEVGAEKPDRRVFGAALRQAGVRAEQALHIGDNLAEDVQGATGVGMQALWLVRQGDKLHPGSNVPVIRSLTEVLPRLV